MKHLATFILLLSAMISQATNVRFNIGTITGGQTNLSFTVQGLVMPFGSTNFVVTGYPMRFTPSGGTITTNLVAGTYRLTFIGPSPAQTVDFAVTNSASTLDVSDLASWTLSKFTASQYYTIDQADARFARAGEAGTNTFRVLNVKELGAEGDGTTDDTTAIQNAINLSTNSALPSSVYFPPGRYKVTSSLRIWPNDTTQNLGARTGPTRLLGDGSGVSIIESYVTNGAAIDARIAALDGPGLVGFTMERLGIFGPIGRGAWTNDASEGLAIGRSNAVHWTGTNWITEGYGSQYYGHQIRVQDCDFSGFTKAIGSTNVWGFVVDGGTFHSNRLHALAFNCTHSASLRNVSVYGIPLAGRLTDIAIGFFAPREAPSWWGFGDTAKLEQTQVQWARVAVYNDELALQDSGGNYQFVDLAHQIRSGSRTNGSSVEIWRPYADIFGATYCDSYFTWVTNSPAMVEIDSYVAPRVTFYQLIGDVCKNVRPKVNIIGATATGSGNNGTLTFGTTNLDYPQLIGGVSPWPALFNGSNVISLTKLTNSAVGIQNGSSGVMLDTPAFYPSIQIESDSLGSQGVTLGTADTGTGSRFTISDSYTSGTEYLRVDDAGISSAVPFAGNASGLTNFTFDTLQTFNDITNTGSLYNSGSILGFGGLNIRGGNVIATNGTTTLGNVTATGTFTGNGSGLTNLNPNAITNAPWLSSASNAWNGTFTGNGSGLTNLNVSTATGLLPMGTVATQYQTAPGPFLSTNSGARGYSYNAGSLTNLQSPRSGSATYTLTDNTEKFISWSGTVSSSGETYAAAPMALGGAFSKFYLAINQIGAGGTNITVKIYTNGTYCGLGAVLQGPGARTNELSTVTGVVPDGAVVSVGIQSSYNGVHPSMYFRWSWVSTK